jgi:predicted dehydrogenase
MSNETNRRDFLKIAALAGLGTVLDLNGCASVTQSRNSKTAGSMIEYAAPPINVVRIGYVGVGGMGSNHVKNLLKMDNVEIRAVCDIKPERVALVQERCVKANKPKPEGYSRGPTDFLRLCDRNDLDLVYTATPWEWHVPVCLAAMHTGKHAATEVPAAITLDDCWALVETSEKMRRHCIMIENCCYDRVELMILNMVKKNLLGEIIHGKGGYLHDLREVKLRRDKDGKNPQGEAEWRLNHSIKRSGDVYPTHGIGPIAQCMDINRGDKFDYLVSMSTMSRGLNVYAAKTFGDSNPLASQKYALGDVTTTLIRTVKGRTIVLTHDTNLPRPYSRDIFVQGTEGLVCKYPDEKIYIEARTPHIEGKSSRRHEWEPLSNYYEEFEHPLFKQLKEQSEGSGHGGIDFMEDYRLIRALQQGLVPDMDVYDGVTWSVISALSSQSVDHGSEPVKFPDFTRGKWRQPRPLHMMEL